MDILVTYDVNTTTKDGRTRLRRVAKVCEGFGQRVQYSVFECTVNEAVMAVFEHRLLKVINEQEDSLRIYTLRGRRQDVVKCFGRDGFVDFTGPLVV
jgi:CRISPR-associated protein Cas2